MHGNPINITKKTKQINYIGYQSTIIHSILTFQTQIVFAESNLSTYLLSFGTVSVVF